MSCVLGHVLYLASWTPWNSKCAVGLGVFLRWTSAKRRKEARRSEEGLCLSPVTVLSELQDPQEPGISHQPLNGWASIYLHSWGAWSPQEGVLLGVNYLPEAEAVPEGVESWTSSLPTYLTSDLGGTYLGPSTLWKLAKHQDAHSTSLLQIRNWGLVRVSFDWKPKSHWVLILQYLLLSVSSGYSK